MKLAVETIPSARWRQDAFSFATGREWTYRCIVTQVCCRRPGRLCLPDGCPAIQLRAKLSAGPAGTQPGFVFCTQSFETIRIRSWVSRDATKWTEESRCDRSKFTRAPPKVATRIRWRSRWALKRWSASQSQLALQLPSTHHALLLACCASALRDGYPPRLPPQARAELQGHCRLDRCRARPRWRRAGTPIIALRRTRGAPCMTGRKHDSLIQSLSTRKLHGGV